MNTKNMKNMVGALSAKIPKNSSSGLAFSMWQVWTDDVTWSFVHHDKSPAWLVPGLRLIAFLKITFRFRRRTIGFGSARSRQRRIKLANQNA